MSQRGLVSGEAFMPAERCLHVHRLMLRSRIMEERMIKMSKSGEGFFWIGGPGEEAFNVGLGLQVKKGEGPAFDYLHLKYRSGAVILAMGAPMTRGLRQMAMTATDENSLGRNFTAHYCIREWNVIPVNSVIGVQFAMAPGTAHVQKRSGGDGVTIVVGGDAGTAEGDFATCMIWSTRPDNPLPVLMVVMNNGAGISTPHGSIHACKHIIDRGQGFGIPGEVVNGNDPIASWAALERAFTYCRTQRRPYLIEAQVSRLYGHSSSSGAPFDAQAPDCLALFEKRLLESRLVSDKLLAKYREEAWAEVDAAVEQVMKEPRPLPKDVEKGTYAASPVDAIYPDDYTGLPK